MTNKQKILIGFGIFLSVIVVGSIVTAIGRNSSNTDSANLTTEENITEDEKEELQQQLKLISNKSNGFEVLFFEGTEEYEDVVETESGSFNTNITKGKSEDHAGLFIVTRVDEPENFVDGTLEILLTEKFFDLIEQDTESANSTVGRYNVTGIEGVVESYEIDARLKDQEEGKSTARSKVVTIGVDDNTYLSWIISSHDIDIWTAIIDSLEVEI